MDGHTALDAADDNRYHWQIVAQIADASTNEAVAEIQATCWHTYKTGKNECWHCGYVKTAEELAADDIPF